MSIEDGDIVDGGSADTEVLDDGGARDDSIDTGGGDEAEGTDAVVAEEEAPGTDKAEPSAGKQAGFAVLRAAVILVAAAVVYQLVIPSHPVVRARLSHLAIDKPGVAAFNNTKPTAGEQDDTQTGLAAVTSATKTSPNKTGFYTVTWAVSQTNGVGLSVYLLPSDSIAATALSQIRTQQLAAGSYSSNGFARRSTGTVDGVPGSSESVFTPTTASAPKITLVVVAFGVGRVNSVVDVVTATGTQAAAATVVRAQYEHLKQVEPGFSLSITKRPVLPTALWAAGAVILAAIAALYPIGRRRRARRRQRSLEEDLAHQVVVHGQVIYKHRR